MAVMDVLPFPDDLLTPDDDLTTLVSSSHDVLSTFPDDLMTPDDDLMALMSSSPSWPGVIIPISGTCRQRPGLGGGRRLRSPD